jgi:hypothetical protein
MLANDGYGDGFAADEAALGPAGKLALTWLRSKGDIADVLPMAIEYAQVCDRLARCREIVAHDGEIPPGGKKHQLISVIEKAEKQKGAIWKLMGMARDNQDKRRVGRPNGGQGTLPWQ